MAHLPTENLLGPSGCQATQSPHSAARSDSLRTRWPQKWSYETPISAVSDMAFVGKPTPQNRRKSVSVPAFWVPETFGENLAEVEYWNM